MFTDTMGIHTLTSLLMFFGMCWVMADPQTYRCRAKLPGSPTLGTITSLAFTFKHRFEGALKTYKAYFPRKGTTSMARGIRGVTQKPMRLSKSGKPAWHNSQSIENAATIYRREAYGGVCLSCVRMQPLAS